MEILVVGVEGGCGGERGLVVGGDCHGECGLVLGGVGWDGVGRGWCKGRWWVVVERSLWSGLGRTVGMLYVWWEDLVSWLWLWLRMSLWLLL